MSYKQRAWNPSAIDSHNAAASAVKHYTLSTTTGSAELIEEQPVAISFNDLTHAIMMCTPVDIEPYIVGFAFSEGVITQIDQIHDLHITHQPYGDLHIPSILANVSLSSRALHHYKQQQQARKGSSGCGLCGIESLAAALPTLTPLNPSPPPSEALLSSIKALLEKHQPLGSRVGAIHATLLLAPDGSVLTGHEDIGRHNALDKAIGWALINQVSLDGCSAVMTSRCSTELIQKAVRAGINTLIHLASPSTLAVELARHYRLNLIHIPRKGEPRFYTPPPSRHPNPIDQTPIKAEVTSHE